MRAVQSVAPDIPTIDSTNPNILDVVRGLIRASRGATILELGARHVGIDQGLKEMLEIPDECRHSYLGADLYAGAGVDFVGDLHGLSRIVDRHSIDFIVSKSVFEHLAMPWKVMLEINEVLRTGGYVFINTLQTFPLHELPWDFFRFSNRAWAGMANTVTGFQIVATEMNEPCRIVPSVGIPGWHEDHAAFINSNLLARKIGPYDRRRARWDIAPSEVTTEIYPSPKSE